MRKNPLHHNGAPVAQPTAPQVTLTLTNGQVQLGSNIAQGPNAWMIIAQMLVQAQAMAIQKLAEQQTKEEPSRIVVPSLQVKGGVH